MTYVRGFSVWHIQREDATMQCGLIIKPPLQTTTARPKEIFLCHSCTKGKKPDVGRRRLTPKEREILTDLATTAGSNEEIAERHNIAPSTVRSHLSNIQVALDLHSKVEMVVFFWTQLYRRDDEPGGS